MQFSIPKMVEKMIDKKLFKKVMNAIIEIDTKLDRLNSVNEEAVSFVIDYSLQDELIDTLGAAMNLDNNEYYGNTISWWVYETNFGKKNNVVVFNNKTMKVDTIDKLYNLCVKEGQQNISISE